jgi:hypothetical protein
MDFYGLANGEILVIVDLFARETILQWLPTRKQEQVAQTILRRIIFERGVPLSIRSDSAPELMKGVVQRICTYLNIRQIITGGHNPRGNAICERANQTLGITQINGQGVYILKNSCIASISICYEYHTSFLHRVFAL